MGLPVTVYRSTDDGAPQLVYARPSEIINVLKKCLVEGYGTKLALGWTLEFEDAGTRKVAFRNSTIDGSGGYAIFGSNTGGDANNTAFFANAAKEMLDINQLVNASGKRVYSTSSALNSNANNPSNWTVIGTSRSFWLFIHVRQLNSSYDLNSSLQIYQMNIFIGDLDCLIPNDDGAFTLVSGVGTYGDSSSVSYADMIGGSNLWYCSLYPTDASSSNKASYVSVFPFNTTSTTYNGSVSDTGQAHLLSPIIFKINGGINQASVASPFGRAMLPGTVTSSFIGYADSLIPLVEKISGIQYEAIRGFQKPNMWVNLESWYE